MIDTLRRHVLGYAITAAVALAGLRILTPTVFDIALDVVSVGIFVGALKLALK